MKKDEKKPEVAESTAPAAYEAPAIEETITPEEMEREVHYAGDGTAIKG